MVNTLKGKLNWNVLLKFFPLCFWILALQILAVLVAHSCLRNILNNIFHRFSSWFLQNGLSQADLLLTAGSSPVYILICYLLHDVSWLNPFTIFAVFLGCRNYLFFLRFRLGRNIFMVYFYWVFYSPVF